MLSWQGSCFEQDVGVEKEAAGPVWEGGGRASFLKEAVSPIPKATSYTYPFMSPGVSYYTEGAWEERGTHPVLPDLSAGLAVSASLGLASHLQSKRCYSSL